MSDIIIKPIITEKMTEQSAKLPRYGFIVDTNANKVEIKKAVNKLYNVEVLTVNTMNYSGKSRSRKVTMAFLKALLRVIFIWEVGDERGRRGTRIPHPPPPRVRRVRTQGFHIRPGVGVWAKPYAVLAALGCLLPRSFCMF